MKYYGMTNKTASHLRQGGPDAFGNPAEPAKSTGSGTPCRHCLRHVPECAPYLILAHKPFSTTQPYSEIGPVFLCADACGVPDARLPEVLQSSPDYLLKAYSKDERIIYGTGSITPAADVASYAASLLERADVEFVDARSSKNNCWLARITRS